MKIINEKYGKLGDKKDAFMSAEPFPHIVLDDFLDAEFYASIKNDLGQIGSSGSGRSFNTVVEEKKWISLNSSLPDSIRKIVEALGTSESITNMHALSGIESLVSTTNGNTKLANYHVMEPGGILGSHVDHSWEPELGIPHVLNTIIYLNDEWEDKDGGATVLFDRSGSKVIKRVPYKGNRAVIFLHSPYSFHGVERIAKESTQKRRTIYVDYYSQSFEPFKNLNLPFDKTWFKHGTTFKLKHLDYLKPANKHYAKALLAYHYRRLKAKFVQKADWREIPGLE